MERNVTLFNFNCRSHVISVGMNTKFTAAVAARPTANIQWYKDGMMVFIDGEKYRASDVDGK